jgi:hypothetical protein
MHMWIFHVYTEQMNYIYIRSIAVLQLYLYTHTYLKALTAFDSGILARIVHVYIWWRLSPLATTLPTPLFVA